MSGSLKPCLRCGNEKELLTPEKVAAIVTEIPIDPSLAAEETVYNNRINICKTCEALKEKVLCAHCGCFVLFRARAGKNYCPHPNGDKWEY